MGKSLKYGEFTFSSDPVGGSKGYARGGACKPMAKASGGSVKGYSKGGQFQPGAPSLTAPNGPQPEAQLRRLDLQMSPMQRARGLGSVGPQPEAQLRRLDLQMSPMQRARALQEIEQKGRPMGKAAKIIQQMRQARGNTPSAGNEARIMPAPPPRSGMGSLPQSTPEQRHLVVSRPPPVPPKAPQMKSGGKVNIPAPKSDMLYSKKEVNAKNLLSEGKAPALQHAKGSVNMAKGGMTPKQQAKVGRVMSEFKAGELHSGSKSGPVVKSRKQAVAIGLSEARKAGKK